jgi:glucose/arabinose dehydrogenase
MKKKTFIVFCVIVAVLGILWAGVFYWKNLRGVGPSIENPPQDIATIIENANKVSGTAGTSGAANGASMPLKLPAGFSISIFAKDLIDPRAMIFDPSGRLMVSIPSQGKVVALPDGDVNGVADEALVVADGLNKPHGIAIRCEGNAAVQRCKLYIGETDAVASYDYDQATAKANDRVKIADLPSGGNHITRTLGFGPDGRLYVSVGSSCNVCNETDQRRAKIFSMNADGSDFKEFAHGLRNSVSFMWHPKTAQMWATEMGRDLLGDNIPPDEINIIEEGKNYGWPVCYGKNIHDTDFDKNTYIRNPCMEPFETPSYIDIPAHSAPLGLALVPKDEPIRGKNGALVAGWPQEYWNNLFVAYHGSWNRSIPTGYKVVRYTLDENGNYLGVEDFITGWLTQDGALGRPVDILVQPGGFMYISDDKAGVIYRVAYQGAAQ